MRFVLQSIAESNPKITEFVHFEIVRTQSVTLNEDELYLQKYIQGDQFDIAQF